MTDTERLDYLQRLTKGHRVVLRMSDSNRGWRLHETTRKDATENVRDAIDNFIAEEEFLYEG